MKMQARTSLEAIDSRWRLHVHRDPQLQVDGHCVAFEVDQRYLVDKYEPDLKLRLGVSYGHNPFTPEMAGGFVPPPILPGQYVFGIHMIGNKGNQLTLYDQWYDAREAESFGQPDEAEATKRARAILQSIPDDRYLRSINGSRNDTRRLQVEEYRPFDWFEIARVEAF